MDDKEIKKQQETDATKKAATTAAKGVANAYAGPIGGKAVDLASKTKLGDAVLNKGAQQFNKANPALGKIANAANKAGALDAADKAVDATSGGEGGLPKDSLDSGINSSNTGGRFGKLKNFLNSGDNNTSRETEGSFLSNIPTSLKIKIVAGLMGLLLLMAIPIVVISILFSVGDAAADFFNGIFNIFTKDQETLEQQYYEKLEEVQTKKNLSEGVCIDINLITAALTVNREYDYSLEEGEQDAGSEYTSNSTDEDDPDYYNNGTTVNYKKMMKQIELLANMQIKHIRYGWDQSIDDVITDGKHCKSVGSETTTELVTKENQDNFDESTIPLLGKNGKDSSTAELVAQHDLTGFKAFFTKKVNEETNYEYWLYQPAAEEVCEGGTGANGVYDPCFKTVPKCTASLPSIQPVHSIGDLETMEDNVFYWNLVNSFIPTYYNDYLPPETQPEERLKRIQEMAEEVYLLYEDMGPSMNCAANTTNVCSYAFNDDGSVNDLSTSSSMSNVKVELMKCNDPTVDDGYGILELEDYIKGVVADEIRTGYGNYEAVKAQAVMARTYILQYADSKETMEDGSTLLKIQNCTNKQVYIDPIIVYNEAGREVYDEWQNVLKEVEGVVLTDSAGNMVKNKPGSAYMYTSLEQQAWMASNSDYRTMLMETYSNADNVYKNCVTAAVNGSVSHIGSVSGSNSCPSFFDEDSDYWGWTGKYNPFISYGIQCTWYAFGRSLQILNQDFGMDLSTATRELKSAVGTGNAGTWWDKNVSSQVYTSSNNVDDAKPGAIVVWGNNCGQKYGHVAVVEEVTKNDDGTIKTVTVSEGNPDACKITVKSREAMLHQHEGNTCRYFKGYIYLAN